jgi:uncharacterized membrane protein YidH (DUF202 family)
MSRFITLSVFGLLLSEIAIFLLVFVRSKTDTIIAGDKDLLGAAVIFSFLIFSLFVIISTLTIIIAIFKKNKVTHPKIWFVLSLVLWVPANIAFLSL